MPSNLVPFPFLLAPDELDYGKTSTSDRKSQTDTSGFFKDMVDNAPQGILVHRDLKPLYVNHAWAALHGMTVEEALALPMIRLLWHGSEVERLSAYAAGRFDGNDVPSRYRYRARHKSGRPFWVEQFVRAFAWGGKRFIQSTIIDVDDQERQADKLRQQRQWMKQEAVERTEALNRSNQRLHIYQSVIDQMSERITVIGTDYRYRMSNSANAQFRHRTSDQMVGLHARDIVGAHWFEERGKSMLDQAFAGQRAQLESVENGPEGRRCHVEITAEPYRDPDETVGGAIISVRDVTAAREAQEKLHLFASAIEQVSDRIFVIDLDYRFRLSNKANRDFHQLPLEAFVDRPMIGVVGREHFCRYIKPDLDRCFADKTVHSHWRVADFKSEHRVYDVILEPYRETDDAISGAVATLRDITEAHQLSKRLAYQARYDQLTGLVNRRAFEQLLERSIKETAKGGRSDALCFIDLDQFKIVNDTVGHLAGDELLKEVAKLLSVIVHHGDVLARLGGDEFALLLHRCSLRRAKRAADQLISALKEFQFFHEDLMFEVGASIGITTINRHVTGISDVMAEADLACYAAKDLGRNRVQIFQKRDVVLQRRREDMYRAGGIRSALDNDRFVLFGQPIVPIDIDGERPQQIEILLRMQGERGQLVMPSAFIPAAERYGFMAEVDRWVIRETFGQLVRRPLLSSRLHVNINLSGVTLNDETSLDFIRQSLSLSDLLPEQVSFEITETAAIRNIAKTQAFMEELRAWGCRFALDDFGSGLSSLNYLKRLPADSLKIDGSFVRDVAKDRGSQVMVKAIIQMAEGLGIETVAEGVEDLSTLDVLKDLGINYVQGFAIGRPAPLCDDHGMFV